MEAGADFEYRPVNAAKLVGQYDALVSVVGPESATAADLEEQGGYLKELEAKLEARLAPAPGST